MNLVEIAKSCGAQIYQLNLGREFYPVSLSMNTSQLHAYTEQVCKQMVEALEKIRSDQGVIEQEFQTEAYYIANQALSAHKQMMGDRQ